MCEVTPKSTVPPLYDIVDERHCVLYLRNMLATFGQNSQSQQGSVRCSVDSKLRDKERSISRYTSHVSANKARKKDYTSMLDRFRNCSRYKESQIKIGWDEEHNTMRLRPKTLLYRYSVRALQTTECLGACAQQLRSERPDEPTRRLPRRHQNQRAIIRKVWQR